MSWDQVDLRTKVTALQDQVDTLWQHLRRLEIAFAKLEGKVNAFGFGPVRIEAGNSPNLSIPRPEENPPV